MKHVVIIYENDWKTQMDDINQWRMLLPDGISTMKKEKAVIGPISNPNKFLHRRSINKTVRTYVHKSMNFNVLLMKLWAQNLLEG